MANGAEAGRVCGAMHMPNSEVCITHLDSTIWPSLHTRAPNESQPPLPKRPVGTEQNQKKTKKQCIVLWLLHDLSRFFKKNVIGQNHVDLESLLPLTGDHSFDSRKHSERGCPIGRILFNLSKQKLKTVKNEELLSSLEFQLILSHLLPQGGS